MSILPENLAVARGKTNSLIQSLVRLALLSNKFGSARARKPVELIGTSPDGQFRSGLFTTATGFRDIGSQFGIIFRLLNAGNGGRLTIRTGQLNVRDGAQVSVNSQVSVSSQGLGNAGTLDIAARSIRLNNQASLTAESISGRGGNIKLHAQDLLLTRGNSRISATSENLGNEGNITIDTSILAALEDSDIIANAFAGPGANIQVTAQGIFGTQTRDQQTSESDIAATGAVELVIPGVGPSRGSVNLPAVPIDIELVQACQPGGSQASSKFIISGRGGKPPSPSDPPSSDTVLADWITLDPELEESRSGPTPATNPTSQTPAPLVEAQGWVRNSKGQVVLTAQALTATPQDSGTASASCHGS